MGCALTRASSGSNFNTRRASVNSSLVRALGAEATQSARANQGPCSLNPCLTHVYRSHRPSSAMEGRLPYMRIPTR
jgi:hypothetical protein